MRKKDIAGVPAFKAEASGPHGNCMGFAPLPDGTIAIFDTDADEHAPVLRFTVDEWTAFVDGARTCRFIPL
ncbi:DUF397 domain-containing protein [Nocardia inohanensis]|uniref:DUF397 domain-containing protein n=1 Tax=Nocardia inohanensis TaxID=209246 RepID=UPI00082E4D59|nr:DUF397 domain-containing protein [Nocardia inohanensis]